jgi:hypothetical protein
MDRQMFKKGGAAGFPDLSGDGQVTQKDILMGRGVIEMQQGGVAPMPAPMPAGPGPEVMAGAMGQIDPNAIDINQAAQGAMQQGIDPAMLEGMLGQYANQMDDLENAEDYEQVINGIRGDTAPIEQRYTELAGIVGQEDAQQTPESVLALVQPVMLMASVDQGIGGLAMEEMSAPVEGAMAEGIMSTVNMGAQEPTQGLGGPAPVNFNQGGAVQYMQTGGVPVPQGLQNRFDYQRSLMGQILGQDSFDEDLAAQEELTKAQMLFDIAQGGLAFAAGSGQPGSTPAQDLAAAFIQPLGNIGARAGELGKYKDALKKERRAFDLSALQTAQQGYEAEVAAARAADAKDVGDIFSVTVVGEDGKTQIVHDGPLTRGAYNKLVKDYGADKLTVTEKSTKAPAAANFTNFVNPDTGVIVSLDVSTPLGRQQATVATQQFGFIEGGTYSVNPSDTKMNITNLIDPNDRTNIIAIDTSTPQGMTEARRLMSKEGGGFVEAGTVSAPDGSSIKASITNMVDPNDRTKIEAVDTSTEEGRNRIAALIKEGYVESGNLSVGQSGMFGTSREGRILDMLADNITLQAYKDGTLDPATTLTLNVAIGNYVAPSTAYNPASGVNERIPGKSLPSEWMDAISARQKAKLSVPNLRIGTSEAPVPTDAQLPPSAAAQQSTAQTPTAQAATPQAVAATDTAIEVQPKGQDTGEVISTANTETTTSPATNEAFNAADSQSRQYRFNADGTVNYEAFKSDPTFTVTGVDLTEGLGWRSGFRNFLNKGAAALSEVNIGTGYAGEKGRITSAARAELDSLGRQTMQDARGGVEGRVFATDLNMLQNSIDAFQPGSGNDMSALSKLRATRNEVASMYAGAAKILREPRNYSQQQVQAARPLFDNLQVLLGEYTAAITIFEESLAGRGIPVVTEDGSPAMDNASRLLQGINTFNQQRGSQ